MRRALIAATVPLLVVATGYATSYKPKGATGGFTETRLNEQVLEVRFAGNGYTSRERVNQLLLRRCAEITLETGSRYFQILNQGQESQTGGSGGWIFSFPNGMARMKVLEEPLDDGTHADAVIVVEETEQMANGRLSPEARTAYNQFRGSGG